LFQSIDDIIQHYSKKEDELTTADEQIREDSRIDDQQDRQEAYVRKIPRNHDRFYPESFHVDDYTPDQE
jgi:hypothetical protein